MSGLPPYLRLVRAPNPGPMTLDGTNTWIIGDPRLAPPVVVDPGPLDRWHLDAVLSASGGAAAVVVLTHGHLDHSEGATAFAARAGCGVRAVDPALRVGDQGLPDGHTWAAAGARISVVSTPGHTGDSCSLVVDGDDGVVRVLTGDTVLGRGTSVITHPDGDVGAYLTSLGRLIGLISDRSVGELLPGHGPRVADPAGWLQFYWRHRQERLGQVRAALRAGDQTAAEVVSRVYAAVPPDLRHAALQSVEAQLRYLRTEPSR